MLPPNFSSKFVDALSSIFKDNLIFAFVFGSFAKGSDLATSDLDTFVCVKELRNPERLEYVRWVGACAKENELFFDSVYPCELVSFSQLETLMQKLPSTKISVREINTLETFDAVLWTEVLSGTKTCVTGDTAALNEFAKQCAPYPTQWKTKILEELSVFDPTLCAEVKHQDALYLLRTVVKFPE